MKTQEKYTQEQLESGLSIYRALAGLMPDEMPKGGPLYWTDNFWVYPDGRIIEE